MLNKLIAKVFGTKHERDIRRIRPLVGEINRIAQTYRVLGDAELRAKTGEFRARLRSGETVDDLLPEAFAAVKETCRRLTGKTWKVCGLDVTWDMVPFDVQLIGAVVLHQGKIAEMATGEGKTLVATMPVYLNALTGKGVHLVTVNDYLALRDSEWMGKIYEFLGLSVGCIQHDMEPPERRVKYRADITYGTNNEFGFDYLRDNMAVRAEDRVQRGHHYTIVDEVDSVLVDEARTPLIISGPVGHSEDQKFSKLKPLVERLVKRQTLLVNEVLSEAEGLLTEGEDYEAGIRLLQVHRAAPKNKRFMKLLQRPGVKKLINQVEADYMRERRLPMVDEDLYFSIDEKANITGLSDKGREFLSPGEKELFVLPDLSVGLEEIDCNETVGTEEKARKKEELHRLYAERSDTVHALGQLLKAYSLFERDVEYVVQAGKVLIVDQFTGRLMPGRRFSDGLHQALEAKEGVTVERETQTFATITLQNYFRMYDKLAGMTGTAETEAGELWEIYKLDVVVIPTNEAVRRMDYNDVIYRTKREKYNAIVEEIAVLYEMGRPVLVGTVSVEVSEVLSRMLKMRKIPHNVLNAKHHQREAEIVALAGHKQAVTIATNMAGRGTDIKLGSGVVTCDTCCLFCETKDCDRCEHERKDCEREVPCGLHIVGTERHESRRIDRQLRGRSGRQGDPGSSRFYMSLEDDLMRLFGTERISGIMDRLGVQEGEVIEHPLVTRAIERAQKRVEGYNFGIRKHLLEYDDVMNQQRNVVYARRLRVLEGADLSDDIREMLSAVVDRWMDLYAPEGTYADEWNISGLEADIFGLTLKPEKLKGQWTKRESREELHEAVLGTIMEAYRQKEKEVTPERMRELERQVMMHVIDASWRDHLYELDELKGGIGLRAYGQKDPLLEYKSEAFKLFLELDGRIEDESLRFLFRAQLSAPPPLTKSPAGAAIKEEHRSPAPLHSVGPSPPDPPAGRSRTSRGQASDFGSTRTPVGSPDRHRKPSVRSERKVGRNDPCPCGSGKKYKKCCGAAAAK